MRASATAAVSRSNSRRERSARTVAATNATSIARLAAVLSQATATASSKSDAWKASDKGASVQNWIECLSDASEQAGDASENFVAIDIEPEESK